MVATVAAPARDGFIGTRRAGIILGLSHQVLARHARKGTIDAFYEDGRGWRVDPLPMLAAKHALALTHPELREPTLARLRILASAADVELDFEELERLARQHLRASAN